MRNKNSPVAFPHRYIDRSKAERPIGQLYNCNCNFGEQCLFYNNREQFSPIRTLILQQIITSLDKLVTKTGVHIVECQGSLKKHGKSGEIAPVMELRTFQTLL